MPAAQDHQRRVVQVGVGYAGEAVGEPRSGREKADARLSRVNRRGVGHHGRGLLVPHVYGADLIFREAVQHRLDMPAGNAEHGIDFFNFL